MVGYCQCSYYQDAKQDCDGNEDVAVFVGGAAVVILDYDVASSIRRFAKSGAIISCDSRGTKASSVGGAWIVVAIAWAIRYIATSSEPTLTARASGVAFTRYDVARTVSITVVGTHANAAVLTRPPAVTAAHLSVKLA